MRLFINFVAILATVPAISTTVFVDPFPYIRAYNAQVELNTPRTEQVAATSRERKLSESKEDGFYEDFKSEKRHNFGEKETTVFSDLRNNIPGEPGIDYPAYVKIPKTEFSCVGRNQGYYADEETGCQVFHICGDDKALSFLCPIGAIFHQRLLICDWWIKVPCSKSREFYNKYLGDLPSEQNQTLPTSSKVASDSAGHKIPFHTNEIIDNGSKKSNNGLNSIQFTDSLHDKKKVSIETTTLKNIYKEFRIIVTEPTVYKQLSSKQANQNHLNNNRQPNQNSLLDGKTYHFVKNHDAPVMKKKSDVTSAPDDMEVKESVGLLSAHLEKNVETKKPLEASSERNTIFPIIKESTRIPDQEVPNFTQMSKEVTTVPFVKSFDRYTSKIDQKLPAFTEMNDGVTTISTIKSFDSYITTTEQYKTKNVHKISGFKINKPGISETFNRKQKPDPDFQQYNVNYHTHYYPETFLKHRSKEISPDSNTGTIMHKIEQEINEKARTTTRIPDMMRSRVNIVIHQNRRNEQATDYHDNIDDKDSSVHFENFGARLRFNGNGRVLKPVKKIIRITPRMRNEKKISQFSHAINTELQGNDPLGFLWAMSQAIAYNEKVPRPFSTSDISMNSTPRETVSNVKTSDRSRVSVQTEFIPSLSYDFSDFYEDKSKYYEQLQKQEQESNLPI